MTNTSELLINIVMLDEPKMLTGSGQNGTWRDSSPVLLGLHGYSRHR
jgi:hypothetical protein